METLIATPCLGWGKLERFQKVLEIVGYLAEVQRNIGIRCPLSFFSASAGKSHPIFVR